MNHHEDTFHNSLLAIGFGGRYDHKTESNPFRLLLYNSLIDGITAYAAEFRADPRCLRPFPEVFTGIANCTTINACAFRVMDTYYVAICRGVFDLLRETFLRLLSRPEVFPWIGDISREDPGKRFPLLPRDSSLLTGDWLHSSMDRTRGMAASWMSVTAINFLVFHEGRHLTAGHVDYASQFLNAQMITEARSLNTASPNNLILQAFETEADTYATVTLLDGYFGTGPRQKPRLSLDLPFLVDCPDKPAKVLSLALTAILAVIKLFGNPLPEYDKWDQLDHPPDEVRRVSILRYAERHLRHWGQTKLANQSEAISEALAAIDIALHEILGDAPATDEYRTNFLPGGHFQMHGNKINDIRIRMRPQFASLAYIDIPTGII